ncbi:ribosome biogenesis factor YjgA [Methylophaga pinxianii]|uniref:ribosome biogenesis factor YjgA n=1 Tax=Methylophaga pinxianii TaxID=2881052 RepID=UPI001CF32349|nr:ribosome biogenesis factor YjgA [Methylophaga pinxianii]MCB2427857.1 DUF615 domain-containing protein [Methylophaga pinxianii]UPH44647.1 DUF615 domain-containing protein [Methylophaga pinxianii]
MNDEYEQEHLDEEFDWSTIPKSKSRIKRELDALKKLGQDLIELSRKDLLKLELDEELTEAVLKAQTMSKGALKRQTGYIGGMIARLDHEEIQQKLDQLKQPRQVQTEQFHQLESWRDRLVGEDDSVMAELRNEFEDFDTQHVRQLVRNAKQEAAKQQPPKSARLLFKYLQQLQQN